MATASLDAQERPPNRPPLASSADTNDWEAYYDQGVEWLNLRRQTRAEAAFYWASRLDPRRAEPLFARWATEWARDADRFDRYLRHDPKKPLPDEMVRIDSLRYRAFLRNPLVFEGLIMAAYQELPGRWRNDAWTEAWIAYGTLEFDKALASFARALSRDPERYGEAHYLRATTYVAMGKLDSAATELDMLLGLLRQRESQQLSPIYESKALLYYAVGLLEGARGHPAAARTGLERALLEDLSFYPAHIALGQLPLGQRDQAAALKEFEQAAGLAGTDAVARYEYGVALIRAQRHAEAATELRAAVALEPYFADPYYWLGEALLAQHDSAAALSAVESYVARASGRAPSLGAARQRLALLKPKQEE